MGLINKIEHGEDCRAGACQQLIKFKLDCQRQFRIPHVIEMGKIQQRWAHELMKGI